MKHRPFFMVALCSLSLIIYFLAKFGLYPSQETILYEPLHLATVSLGEPSAPPSSPHPVVSRLHESGRRRFFASKDVIIRAVYFDDRPRNKHQNASVFLVLVWKPITDNKLITGCQVGETRAGAGQYEVKLIGETKMWRIYPAYNKIDHEEALVHCYDLPAQNGSQAFLYYKTSNVTEERRVKAERLLMFPAPRITPSSPAGVKFNLTFFTCTKVYGNPPWLKEWLAHQRDIGAEHVHLIADESFFRGIPKELSYHLEQLIREGFLSVDFWIGWLNNGKEVWYHNQGLILEDCVYQFRGTYDYVFILDTDDFFTPRVPGQPLVQHYIKDMCYKGKKSSCKFRWVEYYPDYFGLNSSVPLVNGNVTDQLKNYTHLNQGNRKSVHRTQAMIDAATHYAFEIMPGLERVEVPVHKAYVAHIRKGKKPEMNKLKKGLP